MPGCDLAITFNNPAQTRFIPDASFRPVSESCPTLALASLVVESEVTQPDGLEAVTPSCLLLKPDIAVPEALSMFLKIQKAAPLLSLLTFNPNTQIEQKP